MHKIIQIILFTFIFTLFLGISVQAGIDKLNYDGKWHDYKALPIFLKVNDKDVDSSMPPIVFGGHSLVPAREVFESLGASVTWNDTSRIAKITYGDTKIYLTINNDMAKVNDKFEKLDLPAKIINNKTMIPARFVSEQLGFNVKWEEPTRTIYISNKMDSIKINKVRYIRNPLSDTIQNVSYNTSKSKIVQVDIESNDIIKDYSSHFVKEPYRLVLDIEDSILTITDKNIPINENGISQIRMSQFQVDPDKTRVVIDFDQLLKYSIYLSSDKKHLKVDIMVDALEIDENNLENTNNDGKIDDVKPNDDELRNGKYLVVIDPGHGGTEPGAIYSGVFEKDLNLDIALRLQKLLIEENINIVMIREDDSTVPLGERAPMSNKLKPDLFVSIHNNAMEDTSFDGTMTLYNPEINLEFSNKKFAQIMQDALLQKLGTTDRKIRERPGLAVLKGSQVPSVLVEVAFMTNEVDMIRLKTDEFKQQAAEALRDGIVKALIEKNK